jgi:hypothetical protein
MSAAYVAGFELFWWLALGHRILGTAILLSLRAVPILKRVIDGPNLVYAVVGVVGGFLLGIALHNIGFTMPI